MSEPRRRRGAKREADAPEMDEAALVTSLRQRAWQWLCARPAPSTVPAELLAAQGGPSLPASEPAPPAVQEAPPVPASEATPPKRRRVKREVTPDLALALRRRAWAWFAPRATGDAAAGTHVPARATSTSASTPGGEVVRAHLKGVLEALIFAAESPMPARELSRLAQADLKLVKALLAELGEEYYRRGFRLDEVAGGFVFRTSPVFAPFVREQAQKKPVKMSRAQIETLAIVAYRQPITRPEVDEVRGVDSGAVLKSLLERELVRIIGKKDEPGRPMLYGTTPSFMEFFGLKSLGDLPTLREFTELTDESRRAYEREMGEEPPEGAPAAVEGGLMGGEGELRAPGQAGPPAALEQVPEEPGPLPVPQEEPPMSPEGSPASQLEDEDDEDEDDEDEDDA